MATSIVAISRSPTLGSLHMLSTPIRLLNLSMGGLWTRLRTALECGWDAILRAAPKQHRPFRTVRHRHRIQMDHFIKSKRVEKFDKCAYCGSYKAAKGMCLFCFGFLRKKMAAGEVRS